MIWLALVLLVVGFLLIFLELIIPSFGTIALTSVACLTVSVVLAYMESTAVGVVFTSVVVIGVPVAIFLAVKMFKASPMGRRMILSGPSSAFSGGASSSDLKALLGSTGAARTVLRPSGIADIGGRRVDVVTEGKMIEAGTAVEVVRVDGNRVVVRARG